MSHIPKLGLFGLECEAVHIQPLFGQIKRRLSIGIYSYKAKQIRQHTAQIEYRDDAFPSQRR